MTMPAGTYYVGDLCYVLEEEWDECCELFFAGRDDHGCNQGEFTLADGRRFVSYNTAYGDGTYKDQGGNEYWVDAGLIGCIRVEDIREPLPAMGCRVVDFPRDFECSYDNGVIKIGFVHVDTDPSYEEEEEDYEYEDV